MIYDVIVPDIHNDKEKITIPPGGSVMIWYLSNATYMENDTKSNQFTKKQGRPYLIFRPTKKQTVQEMWAKKPVEYEQQAWAVPCKTHDSLIGTKNTPYFMPLITKSDIDAWFKGMNVKENYLNFSKAIPVNEKDLATIEEARKIPSVFLRGDTYKALKRRLYMGMEEVDRKIHESRKQYAVELAAYNLGSDFAKTPIEFWMPTFYNRNKPSYMREFNEEVSTYFPKAIEDAKAIYFDYTRHSHKVEAFSKQESVYVNGIEYKLVRDEPNIMPANRASIKGIKTFNYDITTAKSTMTKNQANKWQEGRKGRKKHGR